MKRFLALITALTLLCALLTACTGGGNVSDDPNGSISSDPADKQTDAASDLTPGTDSTDGSTNGGTTGSDSADIFDLPNDNGNGTGGVNGNGGNGVTGESNGTNGNGTNGTENGVGVPQGRGMRGF